MFAITASFLVLERQIGECWNANVSISNVYIIFLIYAFVHLIVENISLHV